MNPQKVVTPAKAGVQCLCDHLIFLDTGFRRYDVRGGCSAYCECVILDAGKGGVPPDL
jgi:hypothetical protein